MKSTTSSVLVTVICSFVFAAVGCADNSTDVSDDPVNGDVETEVPDVAEPTDATVEDTASADSGDETSASDTDDGPEDDTSDESVDTAKDGGGDAAEDTGMDGGGDVTEDTGCQDPGCPCNYEQKTQGVCSEATTDSSGDCQPPNEYEANEQTCDDLDNDCDGDVDEGCDNDGDDYCDEEMSVTGSPSACPKGGGDCEDEMASVNPGANEACDDDIDNDCDGATDCDDSDCSGRPVCDSGGVEQACGDGVDNDSDGCTDCSDSDCTNEPCGPASYCCTGMPSPGQCVNGSCVPKGTVCPQ